MRTSLKVDLLKITFVITYLLIVMTAVKAWSDPLHECGENPFSTEIIKYKLVDDCYQVILEVSHNNEARYELSHANFYFSCGTISDYKNSIGRPIEIVEWNHEPIGVKVDGINNFGKDPSFSSFTVEFSYCPDEKRGDEFEFDYYCQPKAKYKAGQCIYQEQLDVPSEEDTDVDDKLSPNDELIYEIAAISPTCSGNDGMIELIIIQGTDPIDVVWDNGTIGTLIDGLNAGVYTYTITDGNGIEELSEVVLESASDITIEANVVQPSCNGLSNGSITLNISGGSSPYQMMWDDGSVESSRMNLASRNYLVTVMDANGCTAEASYHLSNQSPITVADEVIQPSCQDGTAGSISLNASGGTAPYTYEWSNGMVGAMITDLNDGYYQVTVSDANGCQLSKTYAIRTEIGIEATSIVTNTNCFNDPVGAIDLTVTGGAEPVSVEWPDGKTTEDISGLISGYYTATITDANGCQITHRAYVRAENIHISYDDIILPSCHGGDGAIYISASNGTAPYTYTWYDESGNVIAETDDITDLSGGKYTLIVTDATGCTLEKIINLQYTPLSITYNITADVCTGEQTVEVQAAGGTPEYTFEWSDGSSGNIIYGAQAGTYMVTVTDSKGCSTSQEITVEETSGNLSCAIDELSTDVVCGTIDNVLSSTITDADYYTWSITSSDGSWAITSGIDQSSMSFTAGSVGSSATITLTLGYSNGCEISCEKTVDVCIDDTTSENTDDSTDSTDNNGDNTDNTDNGGDTTNDDNTTDAGDTGDTGDSNNEDGTQDGGSTDDGNTSDDNSDGSNTGDPDDNRGDADGNAGVNPDGDTDEPVVDKGDKTCDECFYTSPASITEADGKYLFSME
jgi:hypothetical protein